MNRNDRTRSEPANKPSPPLWQGDPADGIMFAVVVVVIVVLCVGACLAGGVRDA